MSPKRLFILAILLTTTSFSWTQKNLNSPFSRFGLGMQNTSFINQSFSMGGLSTSLNDPYTLNIVNPASYTSLKYTSAEFSFQGGLNTLSDNSNSSTSFNGHLGGFAIGFPMVLDKNYQLGAALGLQPNTQMGYNIVVPGQMNSTDSLYYEGLGGTNEVFFGLAYGYKGFSLGMNYAYQFGQLKQNRTIVFDSTQYYDTRIEDKIRLGNFLYDIGLQYQSPELYKDWSIVVGATYRPKQAIQSKRERLAYAANSFVDTIYNSTNDPDIHEGFMPSTMSYGLGFRKGENFFLGFDYETQNWTELSIFDINSSLVNSQEMRFGAEWSPLDRSDRLLVNNSVFERMSYRAGLRYNNSYITVNDNQVNEFGINFGFNLPVFSQIVKGEEGKPISSVSLGFEIGKRGDLSLHGLSEDFYKFNLTYTFNDRWFKPEKIE